MAYLIGAGAKVKWTNERFYDESHGVRGIEKECANYLRGLKLLVKVDVAL